MDDLEEEGRCLLLLLLSCCCIPLVKEEEEFEAPFWLLPLLEDRVALLDAGGGELFDEDESSFWDGMEWNEIVVNGREG